MSMNVMDKENSSIFDIDLEEPSSEDLIQWAKENIGENPDTKCQLVSDLRDLIYERGDVEPQSTEDEVLIRFLRARFFKLENTYRLYVSYHDFKESNQDLCKNVDIDILRKVGKAKIILPPIREQTGRRVLFYKVGNWVPKEISVEELLKTTILISEVGALEPKSQILGAICVLDFKDLTMEQALYATPGLVQKILQIALFTFPMRIHAFHIINQSYIFDFAYRLFTPFLKESWREKVFFHGDLVSLYQHIDPNFLPVMYGGLQPDYDCELWIAAYKNNKYVIDYVKSLGYTNAEIDEK